MTRTLALVVFLATWNPGIAQDLVITNARIIDGTGQTIQQGSVVVTGGRIVSVSAGTSAGQGLLQIDAQGMTVMPGLINTHWHLLAGSGAANDEAVHHYVETVVADTLESLVERGVTTIMSPGDHFPNILELRQQITNGEMRGPRLIVVGPVFTAPDDWPTQLCRGNSDCKARLTAEVTTPQQARTKVRELAAAGVDAVKLVYDDIIVPNVRIDDDVVAAIADEARLHDLILFAHISTVDETVLTLVELGVRGLVHPVPFRSTESRDGAQILRDLQIPVSTTISVSPGEWSELALDAIKHLWDQGVIVAFGTDSVAGQGSSEDQFLAEARALNRVLSNRDVLTTLTRNAALYLGLGDEIGTLEPGKLADIVIIDGDPLADISDLANVSVVIQGGQIVVDNR